MRNLLKDKKIIILLIRVPCLINIIYGKIKGRKEYEKG